MLVTCRKRKKQSQCSNAEIDWSFISLMFDAVRKFKVQSRSENEGRLWCLLWNIFSAKGGSFIEIFHPPKKPVTPLPLYLICFRFTTQLPILIFKEGTLPWRPAPSSPLTSMYFVDWWCDKHDNEHMLVSWDNDFGCSFSEIGCTLVDLEPILLWW